MSTALEALKWARRECERALSDAGYDPTDHRHQYVIRYMAQFQKHTANVDECACWAVARATNLTEQKSRRHSHGTGATYDG